MNNPDKPIEQTKPLGEAAKPRKRKRGCLKLLIVTGLIACAAAFGAYKYCIEMPGENPAMTAGDTTPETSTSPAGPSPDEATHEATDGTNAPETSPAEPVELTMEAELETYVTKLASEIGERNLHHLDELNEAADWIESQFQSYGYIVTRHTFQVNELDCHNIIAEKTGTSLPGEIILVGGHYDSVVGTPGANDNGSGTAATIALARRFADVGTERTLRFVAFTNEEPPYFQREDLMGSLVYAHECRMNNDDIRAVLSLETMGYYSDEPESQKYPPPLNLMYPDTGNFIGFVANLGSRDLLHRVIAKFRESSDVPSEGASLPGSTPGVGWSDHWSFWQEGYAGIMITDTAPFRYPHYHLATDTVDKIDFVILAKVVEGLVPVIEELANESE